MIDLLELHRILAADDAESMIHRRNILKTCGKCHGELAVMAEGMIRMLRAAMTYESSVHGQAVSRGQEKPATCLDCHGDHSLKGAGDATSTINVNNIANTCGGCHHTIKDEYLNSIHGRALRAGISDSPTCTGCHGEHQILSPENPKSPTSGSRQAEETCARCHNNPTIIAKYGLEGSVVTTYEDSYHGLAVKWQSQRAATDRRPGAVSAFWAELTGKAPLVEAHPDDPKDVLVTFAFRAAPQATYVGLIGGPAAQEVPMRRLADSDVWYLTARMPADARFKYAFIAADGPPEFRYPYRAWGGAVDPRYAKRLPDPNNPNTDSGNSLVELPGAPAQPWLVARPDVRDGDAGRRAETRGGVGSARRREALVVARPERLSFRPERERRERAPFVYIRFLGNHREMDAAVLKAREEGVRKSDWESLIKDRTPEMKLWITPIRRAVGRQVPTYVYFNNHYAGYAPGSVELFRSLYHADAG